MHFLIFFSRGRHICLAFLCMFVYYKKDVKGEHARGIIRRLQRSQIFILLVNKCFVFFENDEHKIWQSCQTFPFCDRTVCTSKILDIWIELTVYLRKKIPLCASLSIYNSLQMGCGSGPFAQLWSWSCYCCLTWKYIHSHSQWVL